MELRDEEAGPPGKSGKYGCLRSLGRILLARIDRGVTMDPVTSPLIHKDSGHQARARSGRGESHPGRYATSRCSHISVLIISTFDLNTAFQVPDPKEFSAMNMICSRTMLERTRSSAKED